MPSSNTEIIRRLLRRLNEQNFDAAFEDVAPDAELDWSGSDAPDSGVYRGPAAWLRWLAGRREGLADVQVDPIEVVDVPPDTVVTVAHARGRGRASGISTEATGAVVWRLSQGRISALTLYQTREEALRAAQAA